MNNGEHKQQKQYETTVSGRVAEAFHEAYEELAPAHAYETREASAVPWEDVPENNKALMRATVRRLLDKQVITPSLAQDHVVELMGMAQATFNARYPEEGGVTVALHLNTDRVPSWVVTGDRNHWEGPNLLDLVRGIV